MSQFGKLFVPAVRGCGRFIPALVRELIGPAGAAAIAYGAWLVYAPAGWIAGGFILLTLAVVSELRTSRG